MPTVEWNKSWASNLKAFKRGEIKGAAYGDQWGVPEKNPRLEKVVDKHLRAFVDPTKIAIEIGSGGGRWTQYLLPFKHVYCVELNEVMFEALKERFPNAGNLSFVRTSGTDIPCVPSDSVHFVFSFGVLVHCDAPIIQGYLEELFPLMQSRARAHLQFSDKRKPKAAVNPDFAEMTPERFAAMAEKVGFQVDLLDDETMDHSAIAQLVKA